MKIRTFRLNWISLAFAILFLASFDAQGFSSKKADALAPAEAASSGSVWVSRGDGGTSCGVQKGQALEEGADELKAAGIKVLDSRKANDGKMHAQMCGAPTGSMNAYQISRTDLAKALTMGFREAPVQQQK